jgi:hypothetical protein
MTLLIFYCKPVLVLLILAVNRSALNVFPHEKNFEK